MKMYRFKYNGIDYEARVFVADYITHKRSYVELFCGSQSQQRVEIGSNPSAPVAIAQAFFAGVLQEEASAALMEAFGAAIERMESVSTSIPVENRAKGVSQAGHVRHMAGHLAQHAKIARAALQLAKGE